MLCKILDIFYIPFKINVVFNFIKNVNITNICYSHIFDFVFLVFLSCMAFTQTQGVEFTQTQGHILQSSEFYE